MLINGSWFVGDDGVIRPIIRGQIQGKDGSWNRVPFLVDTGADRTVLSAAILGLLGLVSEVSSQQLGGVGGKVETVALDLAMRFLREDGTDVTFKGTFFGFPSPDALDMSVLGRDILNLFALIVDRPRDVVCLLSQRHHYKIEQK